MQAPELTLDAALVDANASNAKARHRAIRNLAPALLAEIGIRGPAWQTAAMHPKGVDVVEALRHAAEDDDPAIRGVAGIALGWLGDPEAFGIVRAWLARDTDRLPDRFTAEAAILSLAYLGSCTPATPQGIGLRATILVHLRGALRSPHPDLRFQAASALIDVGGEALERELVTTLGNESHPEVRENLVIALSRLPRPEPATLDALVRVLEEPREAKAATGFEAALALAAAGRTEGITRLAQGLGHPDERDRALEALAVLKDAAEPDLMSKIETIAAAWWLPSVTRVRAAYALVRLGNVRTGPGQRGFVRLRWLAWHPRRSVREAVAEAFALLRRRSDHANGELASRTAGGAASSDREATRREPSHDP